MKKANNDFHYQLICRLFSRFTDKSFAIKLAISISQNPMGHPQTPCCVRLTVQNPKIFTLLT